MSNLKRRLIYLIISLILLTLVVLSVDFDNSILQIILHLTLGFFLTQWYIVFGLIGPKLQEKAWKDNYRDIEDPQNEFHSGFVKKPLVILFSILVAAFINFTVYIITPDAVLADYLVITAYVLGPTLILLWRHWLALFISVLWVWWPIEWDFVDDALGNLDFELLPPVALVGLFTLLWPAVAYGRHLPWYNWDISKKDLKYFNIASIVVTIAVVPLGILINFLKFNLTTINEHEGFGDPASFAVMVFLGIFLVQGLMEETLFRGFIFKHWYYQLQLKEKDLESKYRKYGYLSILFSGFVIASIPFWAPALGFIGDLVNMPQLDYIVDKVGDLTRPLGDYEGAPIEAFASMPLWPFYLGVGLILTLAGFIVFKKYPSPVVAAVIAQGMIFGFAHFQDWRYVFFATLAGIGYGYTYFKTRNIVASAMVHMGVDAIWSLFLSYP